MADPDRRDRLLAGRYRLGERLGRGGMGTVWQATDELLGRQVAVKELHFDEVPTGTRSRLRTRRERSLREARAVAQIQDPHVIVVHDVVEQDGRPWIVMEWVDGESLAERLERGGPLAPREVARIGVCLLGALRAAHAHGVLHRDLKPANVMLETGTGRVVLTDFGVAQVSGATTLTEDGGFVGSPEYTAPERIAGVGTGPEADLWSLGALLCTALSGSSPFHRDSLGGVLQAVMHDPVRLPEPARALEGVVRGLLERDPELRWDVGTTETALRHYLLSGRLAEADAAVADHAGAHEPSVLGAPWARASRRRRHVPLPRALADRGLAAAARPPTGRGMRVVLGTLVTTTLGAGAVLVLLWGVPHDGPGDARPPGHTASGSPGRPSVTPTAGSTTGPLPPGSSQAPPAPSVTIPAGYVVIRDPSGFTLAVPAGFHRTADGSWVRYVSADDGFELGVRTSPADSAGPLAAARWADGHGRHRFPGYRGAEVTGTTHNGYPAASWDFGWDGDGHESGARHTSALLWDESGRRYEVWADGPAARRDTLQRHFATALDTFRPGEGDRSG
ncbi:protein kinase [Streptomyces sp. NPDC059740]|uniref:serine/threonine-protein kinase n=1 Tax=Streptomyces sp. NPDC059740 TaxID=3346926 RepID=UPI0036694818